MRYLSSPTDENGNPYDAGEVFDDCISIVRNRDLKTRLSKIKNIVKTESLDYSRKAEGKKLYQKSVHDVVGRVTCNEMVKVYTGRMVPKGSKGRAVYDRILSAPPHRRCPFCGIGTVNTLDHYLPKTAFPIFSVTPNNLVPACEWCQGEKAEYYPTAEDNQIFHPYFDDFDNQIWLVAEVVVGVPAAFRYEIVVPENWPDSFRGRAETHLRELNLRELYSSNAGSRLSEIRHRLLNLHQKGGVIAVREHINEELISAETEHNNSWLTAMYRAAHASDWFCNGGFQET